MITEILGKVSITPKGQWVAGTYKRLDLVTNAGSSYLSMKDGNISELTVATDWMLVAEKGRAFEYSDFTPEQIAELQRPATDAAGSIALLEGEIEGEEALRVQAEIDRQTNTATAIQNANNAATNANTKAGLADTAATNANAAEVLRGNAETTRVQNEQGRVTAEGLRVTAEQARQAAGYITSPSAMQIVQLTQAQYDALNPKIATTIYLIIQA